VIIFGRFIYGTAVGAFSVFTPLYINETSPPELKKTLGALTSILIITGVMIAFLFGLVIPYNPISSAYKDDNGVL